MTAASEPTDCDAAEQQLRMELVTVQIDHGRVDIERMKQDSERLRLNVQRAIKAIETRRDEKLLTIEIWKLVVGAAAGGAALLAAILALLNGAWADYPARERLNPVNH